MKNTLLGALSMMAIFMLMSTNSGTTQAPPRSQFDLLLLATSNIKAQSWNYQINNNSGGATLTSGTVYFTAMYLTAPTTITGAYVPFSVQGVYTPTNNNRVGLYSSDGTTLTLVASNADTPTMYSATSGGSMLTQPFSSTYSASAGLYYIAYIWCSSATTTAPRMPQMTLNGPFVNAGIIGTNWRFGSLSGQTNLPSTQALSGVAYTGGSGQTIIWGGIY